MNLSGSTNGKPINVTASSSPGTTIHTATSNSTPGAGGIWDEIWVWISFDTLIGIPLFAVSEFGGATSPDNVFRIQPMYQSGTQLIIPGLILQNSKVLKIWQTATTSGNLCVSGFVNRITN